MRPTSRGETHHAERKGSAADAFGLAPDETKMVAAHSSDLAAAREAGLRTTFVACPDEFGCGTGELSASVPVDVSASGLEQLARALASNRAHP